MRTASPQRIGTRLLAAGVAGLLIALLVNAVAAWGFDKPGATPFTDPWWTQWFPAYTSWLVFVVIGAVFRAKRR